ncbi:MAG: glycosyltransferase [Muribaculaceae bacterium]|jgi:Glycosyltransferases involved in cell wall biogenesis
MNPLISIVIPAYNIGERIIPCIESIQNQSYDKWELIIVNDGSKDNTPQISDQFALKDTRIKVIHTPNQGALNARLTGVRNSKGVWITFVDADDTLTPEAVEHLVDCIADNRDIIVGTMNINNRTIFKHQVSGELSSIQYLTALLQYHTSIGPFAKLYRKSLFDNLSLKLKKKVTINEDLLMLMHLSILSRRIFVSNDNICYNYFAGYGISMTKMSIDIWEYFFEGIDNIICKYKSHTLDKALFDLKLCRIEKEMILKGQFLTPKYQLYHDVINSPFIMETSYKQKLLLKIIKSTCLQKFYYKMRRQYTIARAAAKRLFK